MSNPHDQIIIQKLWQYGHFNNPDMPTGVTEDDLATLNILDEPVRTAIASYQTYFSSEYHSLAEQYGANTTRPLGHMDPATFDLLNMPRCAVSDFVPDGTGSWPKNCHPDYPGKHAITIKVSTSRLPSFLSPVFEQVWELAVASYADMGLAIIRTEDAKHNLSMSFEVLRGSTIGLAIVGRNQSCGTDIWCKFDPGYNPRDTINQWARLLAHEWGHNMGMGHTRGGIMNASITSGQFTRTAWRGDPAESTLRRYFDGIPITPPTEPPVDPPTDPDPDVWFSGEFIRHEKGKPDKSFILIPKPEI